MGEAQAATDNTACTVLNIDATPPHLDIATVQRQSGEGETREQQREVPTDTGEHNNTHADSIDPGLEEEHRSSLSDESERGQWTHETIAGLARDGDITAREMQARLSLNFFIVR